MDLFIKVVNKEAVEHPVFKDNLQNAYGFLPDNYEPFERTATSQPQPEMYKIRDENSPLYVKGEDGIWRDNFVIRDMTEQEKEDLETNIKKYLTKLIEDAKVEVEKKIQEAPNEHSKQAWGDYLYLISAFDVDNANLEHPHLPSPPSTDSEGNVTATYHPPVKRK